VLDRISSLPLGLSTVNVANIRSGSGETRAIGGGGGMCEEGVHAGGGAGAPLPPPEAGAASTALVSMESVDESLDDDMSTDSRVSSAVPIATASSTMTASELAREFATSARYDCRLKVRPRPPASRGLLLTRPSSSASAPTFRRFRLPSPATAEAALDDEEDEDDEDEAQPAGNTTAALERPAFEAEVKLESGGLIDGCREFFRIYRMMQ
jgi:hypothetical protein